jgi:dihydroorotase
VRDVVISGGTVVDQTGERSADVHVRDGVVVAVGDGLDVPSGATELDASDAVVAPGLVDLHTHLREPGGEQSETIASGARAAALGGYTAVVAMPNTDPPMDDAAVVQAVLDRGRAAPCDVHAASCITLGRAGERLAPLGELHDLGVRIFTDDGACLADAALMRSAFEYASMLPGAVIAQHAEDASLAAGGHMHEGEWSSKLGIRGRPAAAEEVVIARDLVLARTTGGRYHVLHLSSAGSVELVRRARAEGIHVTAEAAPHHFTLTDAACESYDPVFKVHPPLRTDADVDALIIGIADGTIDAIATDHAPHAPETKLVPFEEAPPGMLGLETALALGVTRLVEPGAPGRAPERRMTIGGLLGALSWRPARIAGLDDHGRPIEPGSPANLCVIDPHERWTVDAQHSASRSRNTPFDGWELTGRVRHTLLFGEPVVIDSTPQR